MAVSTRYEQWSPEEVSILVANARNDARNRDGGVSLVSCVPILKTVFCILIEI